MCGDVSIDKSRGEDKTKRVGMHRSVCFVATLRFSLSILALNYLSPVLLIRGYIKLNPKVTGR